MTLRELIPDAAHWSRYAFARAEDGEPVAEFSPEAVQFCLEAAANRQSAMPVGQMLLRLLHTKAFQEWSRFNANDEYKLTCTLASFNDTSRWEDIDAAIKEATP